MREATELRKSKKLWIAMYRHAHAEHNEKTVSTSTIERATLASVGLTERGKSEARGLGKEFTDFLAGTDARRITVYVSPLLRCMETVDIALRSSGLDRSQVRVCADINIREWNAGINGVSTMPTPTLERVLCVPPGGESIAQVFERSSIFMGRLFRDVARYDLERVLVVTSGMFARVFLTTFMHLDLEREFLRMENLRNASRIDIASSDLMRDCEFRYREWNAKGVNLRPSRGDQ